MITSTPEPLPRQRQRNPERHHRKQRQHQHMAQRLVWPTVKKQWAHQVDGHRQGQPVGDRAHKRGQLFTREKDAREEHHGREEQGEVVSEEVVAFGQRIEDKGDAAEGNAHKQQNWPRSQELPALDDAQRKHHA